MQIHITLILSGFQQSPTILNTLNTLNISEEHPKMQDLLPNLVWFWPWIFESLNTGQKTMWRSPRLFCLHSQHEPTSVATRGPMQIFKNSKKIKMRPGGRIEGSMWPPAQSTLSGKLALRGTEPVVVICQMEEGHNADTHHFRCERVSNTRPDYLEYFEYFEYFRTTP